MSRPSALRVQVLPVSRVGLRVGPGCPYRQEPLKVEAGLESSPMLREGATAQEQAVETDSLGGQVGASRRLGRQVSVWKKLASDAPKLQGGPVLISRAGNKTQARQSS